MKANYRKVPPYMTKAGVQIGLLHQEPFETRIDKDAYKLQKRLLAQRYKPVKKFFISIDEWIIIVCVITLIGMVLGGIYGFI